MHFSYKASDDFLRPQEHSSTQQALCSFFSPSQSRRNLCLTGRTADDLQGGGGLPESDIRYVPTQSPAPCQDSTGHCGGHVGTGQRGGDGRAGGHSGPPSETAWTVWLGTEH